MRYCRTIQEPRADGIGLVVVCEREVGAVVSGPVRGLLRGMKIVTRLRVLRARQLWFAEKSTDKSLRVGSNDDASL